MRAVEAAARHAAISPWQLRRVAAGYGPGPGGRSAPPSMRGQVNPLGRAEPAAAREVDEALGKAVPRRGPAGSGQRAAFSSGHYRELQLFRTEVTRAAPRTPAAVEPPRAELGPAGSVRMISGGARVEPPAREQRAVAESAKKVRLVMNAPWPKPDGVRTSAVSASTPQPRGGQAAKAAWDTGAARTPFAFDRASAAGKVGGAESVTIAPRFAPVAPKAGSVRPAPSGHNVAMAASEASQAVPQTQQARAEARTEPGGRGALRKGDPADGGAGPSGGDVFLDGTLVGRWLARHLAREAGLPSSGPTGFDARRSPERPGATLGIT